VWGDKRNKKAVTTKKEFRYDKAATKERDSLRERRRDVPSPVLCIHAQFVRAVWGQFDMLMDNLVVKDQIEFFFF